jgi:hypothetical protein
MAASHQMQESAGVDEMTTVCIADTIWPASCEKITLFRHGVLLPKIEFSPITPSKTGQPIAFPVNIAGQLHRKTDVSDPVLPARPYKIITGPLLKRHNSRYAA